MSDEMRNAETADSFWIVRDRERDAAAAEPAYHEMAELTRAFMAIRDPEQRAALLVLARTLARSSRIGT